MEGEKITSGRLGDLWLSAERIQEFLDQPGYVHGLLEKQAGFRTLYPGIEEPFFKNAIDCHPHVGPDYVPRAEDIFSYALEGARLGMRGIVLKNHYHMTAFLAHGVQKYVDLLVERGELSHRIMVYGDICLNFSLDPRQVEIALKYPELKMIRFPTFESMANKRAERSSSPGLPVVDSRGRLLPEAEAIVQLAKEHRVALCTSHLGVDECFALTSRAREVGVQVIVNHPLIDQRDMGIPIDRLVELAEMGAYIGIYAMMFLPNFYFPAVDPNVTIDTIHAVGPDRCIMASDVGQVMNWRCLDGLRMLVRGLLGYGLTPANIETMFQRNPARLLGLD